MVRELTHFINGRHVKGTSGRFGDVYNPTTGEVQAKTPFASAAEVRSAVEAAQRAFPEWSAQNPQKRARVMFNFKTLVEKNMDELAAMLSSEHGKVIADSKGDIQRGLEVIEFACGIPHLMKGEYTEGAGPGIDMYSMRQPLGVVAGITPFNFPAMIPMWMFGVAIACGNTFVCKPSEKDPSVPLRLAELFMEAGGPAGVLNVVVGDKEAVDTILKDPDIKAVSFVGSTAIAEYVYMTGTAHGKRVQAMGGAKNHAIIMPDADLDQVVDDLIGAGYGSAGERCMAISVAVAVGTAGDAIRAALLPRIAALRLGAGTQANVDIGPLITAQHLERVRGHIAAGEAEGAELVVDGRVAAAKLSGGFFLGPTLFDRVSSTMRIWREEIFGPLLPVRTYKTTDDAIGYVNDHERPLGLYYFGNDKAEEERVLTRTTSGGVTVNDVIMHVAMEDLPFGGIGPSGMGSYHGYDGFLAFSHPKAVYRQVRMDLTAMLRPP